MTEHKAGRERDALIHKEIFGHEIEMCTIHHSYSCCGRNLPHYSTQIADAWLVVEHDMFKHFRVDRTDDRGEKWFVGCSTPFQAYTAFADTAPLAICLAALKAVE